MIFRSKPIRSQFDIQHDFGLKDLIVSGCSFSDNNRDDCAVVWPYYLRDLGGFERVLDTSLPGAGNFHIMSSLIWALENDRSDPRSSLVIVMWSGNDRDDAVMPVSMRRDYHGLFQYTPHVFSAVTGGQVAGAYGNHYTNLVDLARHKDQESRAVENFVYIAALYHYLKAKQYRFVFLDYMDRSLTKRSHDFDIKQHLEPHIQHSLESMITPMQTVYEFSLRNNFMAADDYHPSPDGHLAWTRQILIPGLQQLNISASLT